MANYEEKYIEEHDGNIADLNDLKNNTVRLDVSKTEMSDVAISGDFDEFTAKDSILNESTFSTEDAQGNELGRKQELIAVQADNVQFGGNVKVSNSMLTTGAVENSIIHGVEAEDSDIINSTVENTELHDVDLYDSDIKNVTLEGDTVELNGVTLDGDYLRNAVNEYTDIVELNEDKGVTIKVDRDINDQDEFDSYLEDNKLENSLDNLADDEALKNALKNQEL